MEKLCKELNDFLERSWQDGKRVGVQTGTTFDDIVQGVLPNV